MILDMGGADEPVSQELIELCDIISPNQTETKRLFKSSGRCEGQDENHAAASDINREDTTSQEEYKEPELAALTKFIKR